MDEQGRPLYGDVFGTDADPASVRVSSPKEVPSKPTRKLSTFTS